MSNPFSRLRIPSHPLVHLALFLATLVTTTVVGGLFLLADRVPEELSWTGALRWAATHREFWSVGLRFSIPLLLILGTHELGHWVACRRYGLPATLPYFIPSPIGIGTFGAVIRIKAPLTDRKSLFDVGASGPLAGFAVTLPILLWGIRRSHLAPHPIGGDAIVFGEPLLFKWIEHAFFPATLHGADLVLSPAGFAAWFGLLVTAINLLPLSQLDGGHVMYAVLGRLQRPLGYLLFLVLLALGISWPGWFLWAAIVAVLGVAHPPVADEQQKIGAGRRALGLLCLAVFVTCFTPVPVKFPASAPAQTPPRQAAPKTYTL